MQVISARQLVSKLVSHFELFVKNDIPIFSFHYLNNNKKIKIIKCHVQGTTRHCMKIKKGLGA